MKCGCLYVFVMFYEAAAAATSSHNLLTCINSSHYRHTPTFKKYAGLKMGWGRFVQKQSHNNAYIKRFLKTFSFIKLNIL